MMLWLIVVGVAILLFAIGMFFWGLKHALLLALNSVIGYFALYAVYAWLDQTIIINIWSVLLTAILGIFGFLLVVILHFLHLAF